MFWFCVMLFGFVICGSFYIVVFRFYRLFLSKFGFIRGILGWLFYIFWMGLWFCPRPRFSICFSSCIFVSFWFIRSSLIDVCLGLPFIVLGGVLGLLGVYELSFSVSSHLEPCRVVVSGVYSKVRHLQYLGGFLAYVGFSLLLSSLYSLFISPIVFIFICLMAVAEEHYLLYRFGEQYREYMERVPRFLPIDI